MSWGFKAADELFKSSSDIWLTRDAKSPTGFHQREISEDHEMAARLELSPRVPESVRDYFDATRMLWVYGCVYYPFFSMSAIHAGFCIELALKERLKQAEVLLPRREHSLRGMLNYAASNGWLRPEGFARIRNRKSMQNFIVKASANAGLRVPVDEIDESPEGKSAALTALIDAARRLRNLQAHPDFLSLMFPGMAYDHLDFTREFVEQLFSEPQAPSS